MQRIEMSDGDKGSIVEVLKDIRDNANREVEAFDAGDRLAVRDPRGAERARRRAEEMQRLMGIMESGETF